MIPLQVGDRVEVTCPVRYENGPTLRVGMVGVVISPACHLTPQEAATADNTHWCSVGFAGFDCRVYRGFLKRRDGGGKQTARNAGKQPRGGPCVWRAAGAGGARRRGRLRNTRR
jgi:hypothetical protein